MSALQPHTPDPRIEAAIEYGSSLALAGPWETNARGQIIMNPPIGLAHAKRAGWILTAVGGLLPGWELWPEVGLHTADGVKAPDLVLASPAFSPATDRHGFLLRAPEICVEIMSPSNTWEEMRQKVALYLAVGAEEVWICDEDGRLHFFDQAGQRPASALVPAMGTRAV